MQLLNFCVVDLSHPFSNLCTHGLILTHRLPHIFPQISEAGSEIEKREDFQIS